VAELRVKYRAPARYDEMVEVRTRLLEATRRKVIFGYEIQRNGTRLVEGQSIHLVTGPDGRARTLPDELFEFIQSGLDQARHLK
jgi:acyl-CoA thioester hydrolase